jgi:SAM-dependent MidA family methyltransferase
MSTLPTPSSDAKKHSEQLASLIQHTIKKVGGWIDFAEFMQLALYATALGYYSAGSQKFGNTGDFVTAPEISPLFAQTISNQIAQVLRKTNGDILELGAGTGKLAADTLLTLAQLEPELQAVPTQYFILEVSDHLRQVQLETLQKELPKELMQRVVWLNVLPVAFDGVVIANEVLDAIPVHLVHTTPQGLCGRGVVFDGVDFAFQDMPLTEQHLLDAVNKLNLPNGYITEICPAASGLIASLANMLQHGIILMIDYGFAAREYYHPQRNQGTLMCHYQHYAHIDPLVNVGLQDITAHVDFTSIAYAGVNHGLALSGFCSQAQFLMNCGILDVMSQVSPQDMARYAPLAAAAQKLLSPAEMGDLFKVIAFSKGFEEALIGFVSGDKSHTL